MDIPTPSNEQHSLLLSIIWVKTMTLVFLLPIHRLFEAYLSARARESLDRATLITTIVREIENNDRRLDLVERRLLELGQHVMQAHDKVPRSADISEMHAFLCKEILELGRRIIHTHDMALSISPEIRELHTAHCMMTPQRRRIYICEEESQTVAKEESLSGA
jgi:hypothetical protein